jgi:hypothetical protein
MAATRPRSKGAAAAIVTSTQPSHDPILKCCCAVKWSVKDGTMSISSAAFDSIQRGTESETWLAPIMEHPLDVGIVFDGNYDSRYRSDSCNTTGTRSVNCGHRLRLSKLMNYMGQSASVSGSGSAATTSLLCPVCQAPIVWVVDGIAVATRTNDSHTDTSPEAQMICFKYGKQFYRLSHDTRFWFRTGRLSQSRIATVLNIHRKSLKIISKGKVIYPDHTKSEQELSQTILTISALDKSKPSLVVMGTRVGSELRNLHQYPYVVGVLTWMVSVVYGVCYQSLQWMYRAIMRPALPPSRPPSSNHQD